MNLRNEIVSDLQERRNKAFQGNSATDHGRALAFDEAIEVVLAAFSLASQLPLAELAPHFETDVDDVSIHETQFFDSEPPS